MGMRFCLADVQQIRLLRVVSSRRDNQTKDGNMNMLKRTLLVAGVCAALSACSGMGGSESNMSGSAGTSGMTSSGTAGVTGGSMADSQRPEDQMGRPYDPADTIHNSDTNVDTNRGGYSGARSGSGGAGS